MMTNSMPLSLEILIRNISNKGLRIASGNEKS